MKAKEFDIKKRDPNWRAMQDIRRSGAGGQHKDKKKAEKQGEVKHKGQMAEGSEQVYKVIAVDKNNALGKKVKLNVKANSVEEVFERLAMSDWYPLEINGEEVIDGKRLKKGVSEGYGEVTVRKWANQVRKDHGKDVKFRNRYEGSGAVDSVIATNSQGETVGVYNRKTGFPTVFEPKQGVSEGDEPDEEYLDKVISDLHKDALGFRPDREFGREWMSSSFEEKLEIYNNLLKNLHNDVDEGIGGMIAGGVGQFIGNKIDPLAGEIMRAHGEIAGRKAEYTIRKYMHLLQKALKQQLDSGGKNDESMEEASDFGEPREILEDVLQTLEREVEWPLTEVMDPKEVRQLLSPIVRAVNDKMMSMEEGRRDYGYDDFGNSLRPGDDEGDPVSYRDKPKGMWFYNVPAGKDLEAKSIGLKQTKSGKWYSRNQSTVADMKFGQGRYWEPK